MKIKALYIALSLFSIGLLAYTSMSINRYVKQYEFNSRFKFSDNSVISIVDIRLGRLYINEMDGKGYKLVLDSKSGQIKEVLYYSIDEIFSQ